MDVFVIAEKRGLRNPDGFKSGAIGIGILCPEKRMGFRSLRTAQPPAVFAIFEEIQIMNRRIAGLVRNSLGVHGFNQLFRGGSGELFGIHVKNIGILPIARTPWIERLRRYTGNLAEKFIECPGILMA